MIPSSLSFPSSPPPSPAESFHTASGSRRSSMSIDSLSDTQAVPSQATRYRPALQIPDHIREHCHIYLDEQLYSSALTLLADLITAGISHPECENKAVIAPLPFHVEIVSCLLIHPQYTSQAPPNERTELASRSITFLQNILAVLGPINAKLDEAFSLSLLSNRGSRRRRNALDFEDVTSGSESDDKSEHMRGVVAEKGRIRRCAKDFWHIVGWAFNCSVRYPKRWKYWKVWLGYMLDVLDADWQERERLDTEDEAFQSQLKKDPNSDCLFKMVRRSLLVQYLSEAKKRSSSVKRVVRSAFTDGAPESLREFPEVFLNETKEVKHNGQKRKRSSKFGDYDDDELSAFDSSDLTDQTTESIQEMDGEEARPQDPWRGGTDSIALRQRVVTLLSRVAAYVPDAFVDIVELYDAIEASAKLLPLPAFSHFFSPSNSSNFPVAVYVSLCQLLLLRFLPSNAQRPQSVSGKADDDLSQDILEQCLLPFPANTSAIEDNAKVSILVENLFRLFLKNCECYHTPSLDTAIENGILARENRIKGDKRRNIVRSKKDESDLVWLRASGERLRALVLWVEQKNQIEGT